MDIEYIIAWGLLLLFLILWPLAMSILLEELYLFLYGCRDWREMGAVAIANCQICILHTLAWIQAVFSVFAGWRFLLVLLVMEAIAVWFKGRYYYGNTKGIDAPFCFALLAEIFSCCVGCLLTLWVIWKMNVVL